MRPWSSKHLRWVLRLGFLLVLGVGGGCLYTGSLMESEYAAQAYQNIGTAVLAAGALGVVITAIEDHRDYEATSIEITRLRNRAKYEHDVMVDQHRLHDAERLLDFLVGPLLDSRIDLVISWDRAQEPSARYGRTLALLITLVSPMRVIVSGRLARMEKYQVAYARLHLQVEHQLPHLTNVLGDSRILELQTALTHQVTSVVGAKVKRGSVQIEADLVALSEIQQDLIAAAHDVHADLLRRIAGMQPPPATTDEQ